MRQGFPLERLRLPRPFGQLRHLLQHALMLAPLRLCDLLLLGQLAPLRSFALDQPARQLGGRGTVD